MRKVILADFSIKEKWDFKEALEEATDTKWEVICLQSNENHGNWMQTIIRYFKYFYLSFCIFLNRKQIEAVVAWQQFFGLILAVYLRMIRSKENITITVMTFIYKAKKGWIGRIYHDFVCFAISSHYIKHIIVHSKNERRFYAKHFGIAEDKFYVVHLGIEDCKSVFKDNPSDEGYCVSAGRSNRDYAFLRNAWCKQHRILRIICDKIAGQSVGNITLMKDCYNDEYLKQIAGCHVVIIPLHDEDISSGQLVLLHAMMFGKPVIITNNRALMEYVVDGVNGFVIDKTEDALHEAMKKLDDESLYANMSRRSRELFEEKYSLYRLGESIGHIINSGTVI